MDMKFRIWLENSEPSYYWATNGEFGPGDVVTAGEKNLRHKDVTYKALEDIFERVRKDNYPHAPSRLNALFLAPSHAEARNWKQWLDLSHIYEVKIVSGTPHITDGSIWSDAHYSGFKPGVMRHPRMPDEEIADWMRSGKHHKYGVHPSKENMESYAHRYWNKGDEWWWDHKNPNFEQEIGYKPGEYDPLERGEHPELILPKGSQISIVKKVE